MGFSQDVQRMIQELKQDTEHYAQRKVMLSPYQHLLIMGQFHAAITPAASEKEGCIGLSLILPRQSMMLGTDRPEQKIFSLKSG